jgi:hypothetical protein
LLFAFSGDGSLLAARDAQGLNVWDVEGGFSIAKLQEDGKFRNWRFIRLNRC